MDIHSTLKTYHVTVHTSFDELAHFSVDGNTMVVVDKKVYELYGDRFFSRVPAGQLIQIEAVEENKVIETALDICAKMTAIPAKRNARLISFGGGIIQDITGFAANILYRGIHWTFYPTTLLAACDSCIGGKTSLNYQSFKNLLGTFFPPDDIHIFTPFFKTLSERDFESGLGEVVKFNVMYGEEGIRNMEDNIDALLARDDKTLDRFVNQSLLFKKRYIEEDEFDRGIRVHLNFAHTFGHAFEATSHYAIPHGTAVAMGTVVADRISLSRGWLSEDKVVRIENLLWKIIHVDASHLHVDMDAILGAIHKDKKQTDSHITAVLMRNDNMQLEVVHDVTAKEIAEAVGYLYGRLQGGRNGQ
jgi:3-dehydroquinate synthase